VACELAFCSPTLSWLVGFHAARSRAELRAFQAHLTRLVNESVVPTAAATSFADDDDGGGGGGGGSAGFVPAAFFASPAPPTPAGATQADFFPPTPLPPAQTTWRGRVTADGAAGAGGGAAVVGGTHSHSARRASRRLSRSPEVEHDEQAGRRQATAKARASNNWRDFAHSAAATALLRLLARSTFSVVVCAGGSGC
jgi:hypothetical protein